MAYLNAVFTNNVYNPHTDPVGGLRIKSIKNYTTDNILANQESYTYGPNENGGGVFVGVASSAYSYGRSQKVSWTTNGNQCSYSGGQGAYVYGIYMGGALYDQALVQGSPVVYTDVTKYYGSPNANIGKTVYNYGTAVEQKAETRPLPAGNELANNQGILIINSTWNKGQLLTQQDYKFENNSYSLVQDNQNTYNILYTDTTYGLISQVKFDRVFLASLCNGRDFTDYAYSDYPIYSGYVQLAQTKKNEYSSIGSGALNTIVNHTYDNLYKDVEVKTNTTNSKGEIIETEKKYPFNKQQLLTTITAPESTALDSMVSKNIISTVEEIGRNNSVQISLKKTSYQFVNTVSIAPVNIRFQNSSYPIETRLSLPKYDVYGNLLEQQKVNDVKSSYVWDYQNRYPIAEVVNASQTDIAFTSFESDGNGNWTVASNLRDAVALTGAKSYNLSQGSLSKSGLTIGKVYIISFWSKSASVSIAGGTVTTVTGRASGVWTYKENTVTATATTITLTGSGSIDELRLYPKESQMTSYTFVPLIGITSKNDPNSEITFYEYDGLQRLKNIKDYLGNIVKNYQYNYAQGCTSCLVPMQNFANANTLSYPVGVFSVTNKLLGNVTTAAAYRDLWNSDPDNQAIGTLATGPDSMHFILNVASGKTSPGFVTGCRYFQYDLPYNQLDAIQAGSGTYVDFGDGSGMFVGKTTSDSSVVKAPNTTMLVLTGWSGGTYIYWIHNYPNSSTKAITFYHNEFTAAGMDNAAVPGTSLMLLRNLRGNYPQYGGGVGANSFQQPSALSVAQLTNWNSISSITAFKCYNGDVTNPCMNLNYAQDFMANNKNLQSISTNSRGYYLEAYEDPTFKISRLKTNWNRYFTNLTSLSINDDHWNREDLGYLLQLNTFYLVAANQNHSPVQTNNPLIPIPVSVIDNVIIQIAAGAGRSVTNGIINILSAGTTRSSVSDNSFNILKAKGWTIIINNVTL